MKNFRTMKSFTRREGKDKKVRSCVGCILLRNGQILCLISLLVLILAFPATSCRKVDETDSSSGRKEMEGIDMEFSIEENEYKLERLDLFIYDKDEILENHIKYDKPSSCLSFSCSPGEKTMLAIANSPHEFNLNAFTKLSSAIKLGIDFKDENESCPVMGYQGQFTCIESR